MSVCILQQVCIDLLQTLWSHVMTCSRSQSDKHDFFSYSCMILLAKSASAKVHGRESLKVTSYMKWHAHACMCITLVTNESCTAHRAAMGSRSHHECTVTLWCCQWLLSLWLIGSPHALPQCQTANVSDKANVWSLQPSSSMLNQMLAQLWVWRILKHIADDLLESEFRACLCMHVSSSAALIVHVYPIMPTSIHMLSTQSVFQHSKTTALFHMVCLTQAATVKLSYRSAP